VRLFAFVVMSFLGCATPACAASIAVNPNSCGAIPDKLAEASANNFPYKFELYVVDPTVGSPGWPYCPPPLIWNSSAKRYIEAKGDFYAKCTPLANVIATLFLGRNVRLFVYMLDLIDLLPSLSPAPLSGRRGAW